MEIEINRDLRKYKSKDVGNFTFWQFGWGLAGIVAMAISVFIQKSLVTDFKFTDVFNPITIIPGVPFLIIGFIELQHMNIFQYIKNIFPEKFLMKKQLPWKSEFEYKETTGKELFGEDCELIPIIKDEDSNKRTNSKSQKKGRKK